MQKYQPSVCHFSGCFH